MIKNAKIISVAMLKGGAGKTTTSVNLAAALHRAGHKVLLVDADPQASLSESLGISQDTSKNLFTEFSKEIKGESSEPDDAIVITSAGIPVIPSSLDLAWTELELVSVYGREQVLTWILEKLSGDYEYIFIDCPPSVGMLAVNALAASDFVVIPLQAEFLPKRSVNTFMHHFKRIKKLNGKLEVLGFLLNRYDERKTMNRQVMNELIQEYGDKVFRSKIRNNIQLAKAQESGLDIFTYDNSSNGAEDYAALSVEFLGRI